MPDQKRSGETRPQMANLRKDPLLSELEDVTVLFSAPPELLERAAREEAPKSTQPAQDWDTEEDEATLAIPLSDALSKLEPLYDKPPAAKHAPAAAPKPLAQPALPPQAPAPIPQRFPQPAPKPLTPARPPEHVATASARPIMPAPAIRVEIGEDELGAILGPRRKARWLAFAGVLAVVLIVVAVARLAP